MPLIKDCQIVDDPWVSVDDAAPLPGGEWIIVRLECWKGERGSACAASNRRA
jgi:hypothetical protein